ncbi:Major vault protein beta, partial [Fasciola gigantica]
IDVQRLILSPAIYYPRIEAEIVSTVTAITIEPNTAIYLRATDNFIDRNGIHRTCGETWLVKTPGAYLLGVNEKLEEKRTAFVLNEKVALHLRALKAHVDQFGRSHRRGDEWLVTPEDVDSYICDVHEDFVRAVEITVLTAHQYCVIENPVDETGKPQFGKKKLVRGEISFFLRPGECLSEGVQDSFVLGHGEGLILSAVEQFVDELLEEQEEGSTGAPKIRRIARNPGDRWMVCGPLEYIPPIQVRVVQRCHSIPLDRNEGIYVRNISTGHVRAVIGHAYMLTHDEELWFKPIPPDIAQLIAFDRDPLPSRELIAPMAMFAAKRLAPRLPDFSRVVTFQVPHNAAVQIYNFQGNRSRVEFGPTLVMLGPEEQFTKLSLSGGRPKKPNMIKTLCLMLGPDFFTDVVVVETADHARLSLQLAYNWRFVVPSPCPPKEATKLFSIPDFVGDASKAMASRIRGTVASVNFDDFHRNSAKIIRASVFGLDENSQIRDKFVFPENNLHITSIDVQSVEPLDQRTRDSLQKSVQLAIEITTNSLEAVARHEADRLEQESRGRLERQKIHDEAEAEEARRTLLEIRIQLTALESCGQATADAEGRADAARIESKAAVELARLRAEAAKIEADAELKRLQKARAVELAYLKDLAEINQSRCVSEMNIDIARFNSMVGAIGAESLREICMAVSENSVRMLSALGLQSALITDGSAPVNLLTTAHGLVGQLVQSGSVIS